MSSDGAMPSKSFSLRSWKALMPRRSTRFSMANSQTWLCLAPGSAATMPLAGCRSCHRWLQHARKNKFALPQNDMFGNLRVNELRSSVFVKHHASSHHRKCEAWLLGSSATASSVSAPPASSFKAVLDHILHANGAFGTDGLRHLGCGSGAKCRHMVLCFAEAIRRLDLAFCYDLKSFRIARDSRDGRLGLRFSAVNSGLHVRRGLLIYYPAESGSHAKLLATKAALRRFATRNIYCKSKTRKRIVIRSALEKLKSSTHVFAVDAYATKLASAELGRLLKGDDGQPLFPNLWLVVRDGAHSVTRFLSRPWRADPYLKDTVALFAKSSGSPAQLIHHSRDLRTWYCQAQRREAARRGRRVKTLLRNLSAAKHRFASFQRPMGRSIRTIRSLLATMAKTFHIRGATDERGRAAARFLRDIGSKRLFACAIQADLADEVNVFLRFLDCETYDVAELSQKLAIFLDRVYRLVGPERQISKVPGYTSYLLEDLDSDPLVFSAPSGVRTLRPPSEEQWNELFDIFAGWLKLLKAVVELEFPFWQSALSFRVQYSNSKTGAPNLETIWMTKTSRA